MTTPLIPAEEIADNLVYAYNVHETQLCELRQDPARLKRLRNASVNTPLAGYTKVPDLAERDLFFATMKKICEQAPKTGVE
jgi:hypothetical protein